MKDGDIFFISYDNKYSTQKKLILEDTNLKQYVKF